MGQSNAEREINQEIYEYGEVERDAQRAADFMPQGSWIYRLMKWVERKCREERKALRDERTALRERGKL
jgi:hypothetical protein